MLCTGTILHNVGQNFIQNNYREYKDVIMSFTGTDFNKISAIIFHIFFINKTYQLLRKCVTDVSVQSV